MSKMNQITSYESLLPMLMNGQATIWSPDVNRNELNSKSNLKLNDAGSTVSSSAVENGLSRVAEGGSIYKKGK